MKCIHKSSARKPTKNCDTCDGERKHSTKEAPCPHYGRPLAEKPMVGEQLELWSDAQMEFTEIVVLEKRREG